MYDFGVPGQVCARQQSLYGQRAGTLPYLATVPLVTMHPVTMPLVTLVTNHALSYFSYISLSYLSYHALSIPVTTPLDTSVTMPSATIPLVAIPLVTIHPAPPAVTALLRSTTRLRYHTFGLVSLSPK